MRYWQLNRCVFSCFLKTPRVMSGDPSSAGRLFQTTGPCTVLVRGTTSWPVVADRKFERPVWTETGVQYDVRYGGSMPWRHLYTSTAVLNLILCRNGSQWRSRNTGVMWSNLLAPVMKRAVAFWITCILCSNWLLTPVSTLLQESRRLVMKDCTSVFIASGVKDCRISLSCLRWKKQHSAEFGDVVAHAQLTVNLNTQIIDYGWELHRSIR